MEIIKRGIKHSTIGVSGLNSERVNHAMLRCLSTGKKVVVDGVFVEDKCYFFFGEQVTKTLDLGVHELEIYDDAREDILWDREYAKVLDSGLEDE